MNNEHFEQGGQAETHPPAETPPPAGVPKNYEQFEELLQKKFNVDHKLHECPPSAKKALRELKEYYGYLLAECPYYKEFIKRYTDMNKEIG